MRIFVASGIFHPEAGGPATYLYHILPEFLTRGHQVTALSFGNDPVAGYPYPLTRVPRSSYIRRQIAYWRAASRLWPGHDVAFVHSIGLPLPPGIRPKIGKVVGDSAWERSMNRGWVLPTTDVDEFQKNRYDLPVEINKQWRNRTARDFDHVIVPSEYLKRMVMGWGVSPDHITVIYNAPEGKPPELAASQEETRKELGLPDAPILLTPARLTVWKGVDHSLHALKAVPDVHLLVAGDGPDLPRLRSIAANLNVENRVKFLGRVPRTQLSLYYRSADYTLLYSGYEGLSHVLLESLTYGTPVIASDKGGNPEVVQHQINGLLVPYVNIQALQGAIKDAFSPGVQERLSLNYRVGLERFDWQTMVDRTLSVLNQY